jgi:hypothetical protein
VSDLTPGQRHQLEKAPPEKREKVLAAIEKANARLARQRAEVERAGSKSLQAKSDGSGEIEGMSYGTVEALQDRDKSFWQQAKGNGPDKAETAMKYFIRKTGGATREDILKFLEG